MFNNRHEKRRGGGNTCSPPDEHAQGCHNKVAIPGEMSCLGEICAVLVPNVLLKILLFCFSLLLQRHEDFYDSVFAVCANTPRSLLHLTRCAIRSHLGAFCHRGVARLPLPPLMKKYLFLDPEGILY